MNSVWGKTDDAEMSGELTVSNLRMMSEEQQQSILFKAIRACDLHVIRSVLQVNRTLLTAKMFGYEGTDVFEIIKNSKTKRCYSYTGQEKDGFFYPLHVASEAGHKNLTILLVKAGADTSVTDYRGRTPEENCNGAAQHAFYELRGLRFESRERYQGKSDRQGQRHGQGVLFFKPEGYLLEERQLYRGSFKHGHYHGHGTLYHPGTDVISYIGRFKEGLKHGRGIEFDATGQKVYQGTFRDDQRSGRGEEFLEGQRTYRGEFQGNLRHGFGIAFYGENSRYYGRYENNLMSGVGIYVHPDGNRFEGMFYNNKADGPGSFYERDAFTGNFSGTHAQWQAGKKLKETQAAFVPTLSDLPDDTTQQLFSEIMQNHHAVIFSGIGEGEGDEGADASGFVYQGKSHAAADPASGDGDDADANPKPEKKKKHKLDFTYFDEEAHLQAQNKTDWWKIQLGKYLKLPLEEAPLLGLHVTAHILSQAKHGHKDGENPDKRDDDDDGKQNEDDDDDDDDMDEVTGYHFMKCTALFAAYVYVTSASKVFEERLVNQGLQAEFPDFETVYHLVLDAVDNYNEDWEASYQEQIERLAPPSPDGKPGAPGAAPPDVESRRLLFMTEKEKRAEQMLKQRAELAVKKGTAELDPVLEKSIAQEVLGTLEVELTKLLHAGDEDAEGEEGGAGGANNQQSGSATGAPQGQTSNTGGAGPTSPNPRAHAHLVHGNLPIARKAGMNPDSTQPTTPGGGAGASAAAAAAAGSKNTPPTKNAATAGAAAGKDNKRSPAPNAAGAPGSNSKSNSAGAKGDANIVNLEDLFDIDNLSTANISTGHEDNAQDNPEGGVPGQTNDFAAELLYIMRMSIALT